MRLAVGASASGRPTALYGYLVAIALGIGVGVAATTPIASVGCGALLAAVAVRTRDPTVVVVAAVPPAVAVGLPWPVPALLAAVILLGWRRGDSSTSWTCSRDRRLSRRSALLVVALTAAAGAGVAYVVADLSLPPHLTVGLDEPPAAVLVAGVLLVSLVNSTGEELLWRGVLASWLDRVSGRAIVVVPATASSFGLSHLSGIPSGVVGVLGAFAFGVVLAVLRPRVGLVGCIAVHAAVDLALLVVIVPRAVWISGALQHAF